MSVIDGVCYECTTDDEQTFIPLDDYRDAGYCVVCKNLFCPECGNKDITEDDWIENYDSYYIIWKCSSCENTFTQ